MFGGYGISVGGLTIAILADLGKGEKLWLKASSETTALFESAGCERFTYLAKGEPKIMGYYSAPDGTMESANEMAPWARLALEAALAASQPKSKRSKK
jgi:DNA transformation protein